MLRQSHQVTTLATLPLDAGGSALGALTVALGGTLKDAAGGLGAPAGLPNGLPNGAPHAPAWSTLATLAALLAQSLAHAKCRADLEARPRPAAPYCLIRRA